MKKLVVILLILLNHFSSFATHVPGGNISYECIGPNTYVISLTVLEDCGTAFIGNTPESISVTNSCGFTFATNISLPIVLINKKFHKFVVSRLLNLNVMEGVSQGYICIGGEIQ